MSAIDSTVWMQHAWLNRVQTIVLALVMAGFFALLGWLLFGAAGVAILLVWSTLLVMFNPGRKPAWVMRLHGAMPVAVGQLPRLQAALAQLAQRAGLTTKPVLHYIPSDIVNAFAVGRGSSSAIAVTDGFVRSLNLREQVAVMAHEVSHVRSDDMHIMNLVDLFSQVTRFLCLVGQILLLINLPLIVTSDLAVSWFTIAVLVFSPTLSALAQLGLSRTREYDADLNAARLTGDPGALAQALMKIERLQGRWLERFLLPGRRVPDPWLLRSHPATEQRVRKLMELLERDVDYR